jgi:hypothetical protein
MPVSVRETVRLEMKAHLKNAKNRASDPPPTPGNSFIAPGFFQYLNPSRSPFGAPPRSMTRPTIINLTGNQRSADHARFIALTPPA